MVSFHRVIYYYDRQYNMRDLLNFFPFVFLSLRALHCGEKNIGRKKTSNLK